ncbi:hypothetical protein B296_00029017 [Ensete ventricosum]|uniref:Kinesin motor domain-containing protein n=1 Tax=Ensete ventricosum TaxID=4639 RepID=A0A426YZS9_ENSVE|nr:hypothetical protein B296_00029017 [Ensete ventricosum]
MESSEEAKALHKDCVKVAVNVRPLVTTELLMGCTDCVTVVPGEPQVLISQTMNFTFLREKSSIFCFLQIGRHLIGLLTELFSKILFFTMQIFKEEVFDLLDPQSRTDGTSVVKPAVPRAPIQIRETANGGITLAGVTEVEVKSKEEMASYLTRGAICRATGSTNMNNQSRLDFIKQLYDQSFHVSVRPFLVGLVLCMRLFWLVQASHIVKIVSVHHWDGTRPIMVYGLPDTVCLAEMKQFAKSDTAFLKQHYEKKLLELEQEKKLLMVKFSFLLTWSWKASREKEVLQLKKEGRRNEYEMHKLLALNQRQKMVMVLQRKTEEAALATKRLKELLEVKKPSREASGKFVHSRTDITISCLFLI